MASSDSTSTIKTLMCYCGKEACLRTSWTNNNSGRRFPWFGDVASGCGFFVWEDPPMCTRAKKIIFWLLHKLNKIEEFSEMRNKVNLLHKMEEVAEMKKKVNFLHKCLVVTLILLRLMRSKVAADTLVDEVGTTWESGLSLE
ncbi:UNVERIFIED_CONTAM: hypothetical protein Sangu_1471400 [Sesamum angustifolium]|uniref:Zinc finger GRF-type domain-containing protein n=1 Tax=Sesamum angustifolium TaxID=2727405 RepID=A0AAW2MNE5_9LAMI